MRSTWRLKIFSAFARPQALINKAVEYAARKCLFPFARSLVNTPLNSAPIALNDLQALHSAAPTTAARRRRCEHSAGPVVELGNRLAAPAKSSAPTLGAKKSILRQC